jgi:hypothetical protein
MRKHSSRRRRMNKNKRGGYSDAASYVNELVGSGDQQFKAVFGNNNSQSNTIQMQTQRAGKKSHNKTKKGGYWANVINQAIVPFSLWGMQHNYKKKRGDTRKNR